MFVDMFPSTNGAAIIETGATPQEKPKIFILRAEGPA
jgi:hypothetical protein